jgi:SAM-dependent methyltransferase
VTLLDDDGVGWPFWAPSDLTTVEAALDLAGVGDGDRFVDLGCGDGQVLVAAGHRGATVLGVEIDEDLAEHSREALAANGLDGEVVVGDLFDLDLDPSTDVVFTYLAPGTLQRLLPALRRLRRARLVTVDFAVPGLLADEVRGSAHLYRLPGRRVRPCRPGWEPAGTLSVVPAGVSSLTCLELRHAGGPVQLRVAASLDRAGSFRTGADEVAPGRPLAIDVRWDPAAPGTIVTGTVTVEGVGTHHLTVAFTDDEAEEGAWDLSAEGAGSLARALRRRTGRPRTPAELLTAAEG